MRERQKSEILFQPCPVMHLPEQGGATPVHQINNNRERKARREIQKSDIISLPCPVMQLPEQGGAKPVQQNTQKNRDKYKER